MRLQVIYMPSSVRPLLPLLESVVAWSDEAVVSAVSNGCSRAEIADLRRVSGAAVENLSDAPLPHGEALSRLHERSDDPDFAVMDSDILATGPFAEDLASARGRHVGVFAKTLPWATAAERLLHPGERRIGGRHVRTRDGRVLGATHVAVYDRAAVRRVRTRYRVDFRPYVWHHLPSESRHALSRLDLAAGGYDAGKVVNALLHDEGELAQIDLPDLHHFSAQSWTANPRIQPPRPGFVSRLRAYGIGASRLGRILVPTGRARERRNLPRRLVARQQVIAPHFREALEALAAGRPIPDCPTVGEPEVDAEVARLDATLRAESRRRHR